MDKSNPKGEKRYIDINFASGEIESRHKVKLQKSEGATAALAKMERFINAYIEPDKYWFNKEELKKDALKLQNIEKAEMAIAQRFLAKVEKLNNLRKIHFVFDKIISLLYPGLEEKEANFLKQYESLSQAIATQFTKIRKWSDKETEDMFFSLSLNTESLGGYIEKALISRLPEKAENIKKFVKLVFTPLFNKATFLLLDQGFKVLAEKTLEFPIRSVENCLTLPEWETQVKFHFAFYADKLIKIAAEQDVEEFKEGATGSYLKMIELYNEIINIAKSEKPDKEKLAQNYTDILKLALQAVEK